MTINSNKEIIAVAPEKLYNMLVSLSKATIAPNIPQISDWEVLDNGCRFSLAGMLTCSMFLTEQDPFRCVVYQIDTDKNIGAKAFFHIESTSTGCELQIEADVNAPIFMQAMIKTPLQQALNKGTSKLKEMAEKY